MLTNKVKLAAISTLISSSIVLGYSGYWFYKSSQIKKYVNESIKFNVASYSLSKHAVVDESIKNIHSSAEKIEVSGFPLKHNTIITNLKFSYPEVGSVVFEKLEVENKSLSSDFAIKILAPIDFSDEKGNIKGYMELNPDHQIAVLRNNDKIKEIKYNGSGYKILDEKKNIIFGTEAKNSQVIIALDAGWRFQSSNSGYKAMDAQNNIVYSSASSTFDFMMLVDNNKTIAKIDAVVNDYVSSIEGIKNNDLAAAAKSNSKIIADLMISENKPTTATSANPASQAGVASKTSIPYEIAFNLKDLDFSNPSYKFSASGSVNNSLEDEIPYGNINIKIDNLNGLIAATNSIIASYSNKILAENSQEQKLSDAANGQPKIAVDNEQQFKEFVMAMANMASQFLTSITPPLKDLGAKNSLSKDNLLVFDIKREKNSEVFINNVVLEEVISKMFPQNNVPAQNSTIPNDIGQHPGMINHGAAILVPIK